MSELAGKNKIVSFLVSSLSQRILSAVVAGSALLFIYFRFEVSGLRYITYLVSLGCVFEYTRFGFKMVGSYSRAIKALFFVMSSILIFILGEPLNSDYFLSIWGLFSVVLITSALWMHRHRMPNDELFKTLALSLIGLWYCAIGPGYTIRTLSLDSGQIVFFSLLLTVFAGDTFAYFGGRIIGGKKLMENVSPKKTWAGAVSGALGSFAALLVLPPWNGPWYSLIGLAILVPIVAQTGDLFMSLVKRVANVKDTGNILPGHGGFLDRLDGIFFAAPVFYAAVTLAQSVAP
jgi:phosphatidate cytidylyltransferase